MISLTDSWTLTRPGFSIYSTDCELRAVSCKRRNENSEVRSENSEWHPMPMQITEEFIKPLAKQNHIATTWTATTVLTPSGAPGLENPLWYLAEESPLVPVSLSFRR